jgi:hypothetical protein
MKQYFPKRGEDKTAGQVYGLKWWKLRFVLIFWLLFHQGKSN